MRLYKRNVKVTIWWPAVNGPTITSDTPFTGGSFFTSKTQSSETFQPGQYPNGIEIENLRIHFHIKKSLKRDPNTCEITINNLSPTSRAALQASTLSALIQAGYEGEYRHLFQGDVRWCKSTHTNVDYETKLQIGDGDRVYRASRVRKSFKANTPVLSVLQEVAKSMGLELPKNTSIDPDLRQQFAAGTVLNGTSRDELTRLLAPFGYGWSIQNGRLHVLRDSDTSAGEAWEVSEETGMLGSPAFAPPSAIHVSKKGKVGKIKPPKMTLTTLLYPQITPGGIIKVKSKDVTGSFKVKEVTHTGDTHGDDWKTEIVTDSL